MRRRWIGFTLGALVIAGGSIARGDDAGCCEVECHAFDGAGRDLHSVQKRDMTQAECEAYLPPAPPGAGWSTSDCDRRWSPESCDANPERGLRMYRDDGEQ